MQEYKVLKKIYSKDEISYALLIFDNGDHIPIGSAEIEDISVRLYDKLILVNDELCAVAESGILKLKLMGKPEMIHTDALVYNPKKYKTDRKSYIENRLVAEGGVIGIRFFEKNNWHTTVFGNMIAKIENDTTYLEYIPKPFAESYESNYHIVHLNKIKKPLISSIRLDFENCEGFTVYSDEILKIHLNLKEELAWSSHDYYRVVKDGYIVLKLNDDINNREVHIFDDCNKKVNRKILERRLCGEKGSAIHDICHLYVSYLCSESGARICECLEIEDIKSDKEIAKLEKKEEKTGMYYYYFAGGKCKRQEDGTILITFGRKNKKESG